MSKASGSIDLKSLKIAGEGASKYITIIDENGIKIHAESNIDSNYLLLSPEEGLNIYKDGVSIAQYSVATRIGQADGARTEISSESISMITDNGVEAIHITSDGAVESTTINHAIGERLTSDKPERSFIIAAPSNTNVSVRISEVAGFVINTSQNSSGTGGTSPKTYSYSYKTSTGKCTVTLTGSSTIYLSAYKYTESTNTPLIAMSGLTTPAKLEIPKNKLILTDGNSVKYSVGDYIIDSGTYDIWTYVKYFSGTYHAWYEGNINLGTGTAMGGGYFHTASSVLYQPGFSTSVTSLVGASNSGQLFLYAGHNASFQTYWWNGSSAAANSVPVRLDMYGRWD